MESNKLNADASDICSGDGICSPPTKKPVLDLNHTRNIDDISTPSDLKFDEGLYRKLLIN